MLNVAYVQTKQVEEPCAHCDPAGQSESIVQETALVVAGAGVMTGETDLAADGAVVGGRQDPSIHFHVESQEFDGSQGKWRQPLYQMLVRGLF